MRNEKKTLNSYEEEKTEFCFNYMHKRTRAKSFWGSLFIARVDLNGMWSALNGIEGKKVIFLKIYLFKYFFTVKN